jgi:hypothetical protein
MAQFIKNFPEEENMANSLFPISAPASPKVPPLKIPQNIQEYHEDFPYTPIGRIVPAQGDCFFYVRENDPTVYCRRLRIASAIFFILSMLSGGVGLYSAGQNNQPLTETKQWTPEFKTEMILSGLFFMASLILCVVSIITTENN